MRESGYQPQVSHQGWDPPWPHRLGSRLAGENKLGTKMEAIERKYARVDAKINYKTFTSKMRSLNSSKKESASRAERARHWNRKLDTWRAFLRKDFLPRALLSSTFFFFGRYLLERHTYPFSNTRIKSHAQSESSFFYFDLCLHVRMNPRNEGFRSFPRQDLHCMACLSGSLSLLLFLQQVRKCTEKQIHTDATQDPPGGFLAKWEQKVSSTQSIIKGLSPAHLLFIK